MDVYQAIRTRKSVREYQDRPVEEDKLRRVLDAARMAPSARNEQEWRFVVVRDRETRERIAQDAARQPFIGTAGAEGLGTCWIGAFDEQCVKQVLGIPGDVRVVELMPLGYPADPAPVTKSRLALEEIVRNEKW